MKIRGLLVLAAISFLASSCAKDSLGLVEMSKEEGDVVITVSMEPHIDTRTGIGSDNTSVIWSEGDSFVAFGEKGETSRFTLVSGAGTGSAKFSGAFSGDGPYTLLYPYSENASLKDGELSFELPHEQTYVANTFAAGASPAIATCTADGNVNFRNLCGVLKLTIKGKGQQLKKIVLQDLAGNMLWGDASVKLDGKEGTDAQTMTLSGGDNTLSLTMGGITINTSISKTFYFVVPAGTLDKGFSLAFHTITGVVYGFLETQKQNTISRSYILSMPTATTSSYTEPENELARGYYKDLFMDGGIYLTSRTSLPSAEHLNLSMEYFASDANTKLAKADTTFQNQILKGYEDDTNGALLYPDGEPRFRVIYVNGGNSREHGKSLYTEGLDNIYTFVQNGGSYTGSCAGSFLSSKGYDSNYPYTFYTGIWPGHTYHTRTDKGVGVNDTYTSLTPEPGSPLLKYYDPGERVDGVRHNGGSYVKPTDSDFPAGTEILMRYYTPGTDSTKLHGSVNAWAYKASESTGRVVVSGSHPEGVTSGPQLYYMASMLSYALDGNAPADVKNMSFGGTVTGLVGDLQYHHYKFTLTDKVENIAIVLKSEADVNLFLTLRKGNKAYFTDAQYTLTSDGANKELVIKSLDAGDWYIGVYCATTVTSTLTSFGSTGKYFDYSGRTDVLNGVDYTLKVTTTDLIVNGGDQFNVKDGVWD